MVDFVSSTALNVGATRVGADIAVANNSNKSTAQNQINTDLNLSARFLAQERTNLVQPPSRQVNQQIDPALLARISLEEELKRRGGGGGGFNSFNPLLFVPYSFKLMAEAIDRAREAINQILNQGFALPAPLNNVVQTAQNFVAGIVTSPFVTNLGIAINQSIAQIANTLRDPMATANKIATNMIQLANVIASAVAAGLKKVFGAKDEDRLDPDNELYREEEGFLKRVWGMFADVGNEASQSNAKDIKSHIDNIAKQVTRWAYSINRPFNEFAKRWFN